MERELEISKAVRRREEFRSNLAGHRVYLQATATAPAAAAAAAAAAVAAAALF